MIALFCAPPAAVTWLLGSGVRRSKSRLGQLVCWTILAGIALFCWLHLIPATRRTNDPSGEGLILHFLIRWGPVIASGWLVLQHMIRYWEHRRRETRPGFPVEPFARP